MVNRHHRPKAIQVTTPHQDPEVSTAGTATVHTTIKITSSTAGSVVAAGGDVVPTADADATRVGRRACREGVAVLRRQVHAIEAMLAVAVGHRDEWAV